LSKYFSQNKEKLILGKIIELPLSLSKEDIVVAKALLRYPPTTVEEAKRRFSVGTSTFYRYLLRGRAGIDEP
jgi:predicted transcriptional regulator